VVGGDPQAETVRVDLLPHQAFRPFFSDLVADLPLVGLSASASGSTTSVMWLVRLLIREARPWARGRQRFSVGPSSTRALDTTRLLRSRFSVVSAFATADSRTL